jgi:histidinol phosphatase-like enzyme (inositol monophosphatase family)
MKTAMTDRPFRLRDTEPFLIRAAEAAADAVRPFFRKAMVIDDKTCGRSFDPVTEGDRDAEQAIRRLIRETWPDHGIRGEEFGVVNEGARNEWIIDPIDGTRAFICGLPTWGTLLGLRTDGVPVLGMMSQPIVGEQFMGDRESAVVVTAVGRQMLRTRPCATLADAFLATTSPRLFKGLEAARYDQLEAQCRLARYGTDCYAYAMVAAGQIDLVVESGLQAYDIAPLIPIIEGAGGVVTSWTGGSAANGGDVIAAGDRRVHAAALAVLSGRG